MMPAPYGLLFPGFMGQRQGLPMDEDLSRLPPDRGLIGGYSRNGAPLPQMLPGPYELAAMRWPAPKPVKRKYADNLVMAAGGKPDGAGRPGEIRTGSDGRNYQYAETNGMAGATGPQGWLQTNMPATPQASPQGAPVGPFGGLFQPENRDVLGALGVGLMRGDFSGGMADALKIKQGRAQENATRAWLMKRGLSAEDAAMAAQNPSLMSMLLKPGETDKYAERAAAAKQYGLQEGTPEWQQFTLTGELPSARGGAAEMSLNTIPIVLENGEAGLLQVDKAGEGHITKIPGGAKIAKAPIVKDTGTEFQVIDPVTREVVQTIPKNVRGAAAEAAIGDFQGKQAATAPADITAGQNALDIIGQIRNDPYLERGTGGSSLFNGVWGTGGYDFQNAVDQAKSGAFLTAIQQMRGLGSLSNTEGDTASKAVTRMNTALSKEAFLKALDEYQAIVERGIRNAQARQQQYGTGLPGQSQPEAGQAARPQSQADYDALPSGSLFIDPEDGQQYRKP